MPSPAMERSRLSPARVAVVIVATMLTGCPGSLDDPSRFRLAEGDAAAACPDVLSEFLSNTDEEDPKACAQSACHGSESPQAELDLASPGLAERLVGVESESSTCGGALLIDPDAPERSLIYDKLFHDPGCGLPMPFGSTSLLTNEERACVLAWAESVANASAGDGGAPGADAGLADGGLADGGGDATAADAAMTEDASAAPDAAAELGGTFWFEAESVTPAAPFVVQEDTNASGGEFIGVPEGGVLDDTPDAAASYEFMVQEEGTFWVWGRVLAPSDDSDSFWFRIDGGTWIMWNSIPKTGWIWDDAHDSGNADTTVTFDLMPGSHTLEIAQREDGAQLDKLVVTNDAMLQPTGLGE